QLAGLPMSYQVAEGVHRTWFFLNSQHDAFWFSTIDGLQPPATQAQQDTMLATFAPADATPGCPG
ncbi:MAG TPA: hypothetical protein VID72_03900, partial [Ktedonobacterales bacterium]